MSLAEIKAERAAWGDPVEAFETDIPSCTGPLLWSFQYRNGRSEHVSTRQVRQCSWNAGGDPASGCDNALNPYAGRDVCTYHEAVAALLECLS